MKARRKTFQPRRTRRRTEETRDLISVFLRRRGGGGVRRARRRALGQRRYTVGAKGHTMALLISDGS